MPSIPFFLALTLILVVRKTTSSALISRFGFFRMNNFHATFRTLVGQIRSFSCCNVSEAQGLSILHAIAQMGDQILTITVREGHRERVLDPAQFNGSRSASTNADCRPN